MKNSLQIIIISIVLLSIVSCSIYSFGGVTLDSRVKTIQIDRFPNNAPLVEPSLSSKFTNDLKDLFDSQANLEMVNNNGDIYFEGEITGYRINPMTATAQQTAAQSRLTITVMVHYTNKYEEDKGFDQSFSFYHDFDSNTNLVGGALDEALEVIFDRITQDIFNASVAQW